jgi:hypothetical protein
LQNGFAIVAGALVHRRLRSSLEVRRDAPAGAPTAATPNGAALDQPLAALVAYFASTTDERAWPRLCAKVQARIDELVPIVPLYVPRRIAVVRKGLPLPSLTHDMYAVDAPWMIAAAAAIAAAK